MVKSSGGIDANDEIVTMSESDMLLTNTNIYRNDNFYNFEDFEYPELGIATDGQIALITVYSLAALLALVGNILVLLVYATRRKHAGELAIYLVNLAVADLLMAIFCIPFTFTRAMLNRWIFGTVMCPTALFMQNFSVCVSIYTMVAIGTDRWDYFIILKFLIK